MESLLGVVMLRDKVEWFEQLLVEEPSDEQLDYVDDVFSQYLDLVGESPNMVDLKDAKKLCKTILKVA